MNPQVVIAADDFTGGNAVAANFAAHGARSVNLGLTRLTDPLPGIPDQFDVVVVSTNSRHDAPSEAAAKVRRVVASLPQARLFSVRIDTTLRGNISSSTAALLKEARSTSSKPVACLCVPAHPLAGRQTVGGRQLLGGVRLEEVAMADDPLHPMLLSDVGEALTAEAQLAFRLISLDDVTGSIKDLASTLSSAVKTADVLVIDALTEQHLERIAEAAALCDGINWVTADPGPFTAALARALGLLQPADGVSGPILAVSGSATVLTRRQLAHVMESRSVTLVPAHALISDEDPEAERLLAAEARRAMSSAGPGETVLLAAVTEEDHLTPNVEAANEVARRLARVAVEAAKVRHPAGLYVTGGDVTAALLDSFRAHGLAVYGEIVPLAVAGSIIGGPWNGTSIVTKGGLVGDIDTAAACIDALTQRLNPLRPPLPTQAVNVIAHD